MCRLYREEIVTSDVHDDESVSGNETTAVGSRRKSMATEVDGDFRDKVRLIFFLNGALVA